MRYTAKVNIDKLFRDDSAFSREFTVETPFDPAHDIHLYANLVAPVSVENAIEFCCCGCRPAAFAVNLSTSSGRYETGDQIALTVECHNLRNVHRFSLDIKLCKIVTFHSTQPVTEVKSDTEVLSRLQLTNTDSFDTKTWVGNLKVPFVEIPNLQKCILIDVRFVIRTVVHIRGALTPNLALNEISLLIEPGEPVVNSEADNKLAPIINKMEEFDSLLLYNGDESREY